MKVKDLIEQLQKIVKERPKMLEADVLIDTEARRFIYHMVDVVNITAEDDETLDATGLGLFVTLYPNYNGTDL